MSELPTRVPGDQRRGRAAASNHASRFEPYTRVPVDDGWPRDEPLPPFRTEVTEERPRRVITSNNSLDIPFERSLNPYRGCEHVIPTWAEAAVASYQPATAFYPASSNGEHKRRSL